MLTGSQWEIPPKDIGGFGIIKYKDQSLFLRDPSIFDKNLNLIHSFTDSVLRKTGTHAPLDLHFKNKLDLFVIVLYVNENNDYRYFDGWILRRDVTRYLPLLWKRKMMKILKRN
jgi:hypothetical protein